MFLDVDVKIFNFMYILVYVNFYDLEGRFCVWNKKNIFYMEMVVCFKIFTLN